ncbi:hypothetical protein CANINC_003202 [Pichia inconspicua]|uniref:CAP-Gly domain-containing protein n=1 Tax=Pichia inconspicua TaxID=52247 RepID=A0A4T0WZ61_9ASCO|nr:hypothetical protein CANINC_003202 [[Candida] inconspicua]
MDDIEIDNIVLLNLANSEKSIVGTIAFIGKTEFSPGIWLGLILVPECRKFAKNNGSVQGKQYFNLPKEESVGVSENFGIFVRPEKVKVLSPESLIAIHDISNITKLKLLFDYLIKLQYKYNDALAKLEILQVEYDNVLFDKNEILSKYKELNIDFLALKSVQSSTDNTNIEDEKLKLSMEHMKLDYQEKENDLLQKIQLLKNDIAILQSKLQLNPDESNKGILQELNRSEELIEKLTIENTELIARLEEIVSLKGQLELQLNEQKELIANLQQLNTDLTQKVKHLNQNLQDCNNTLENEKTKNQSLSKELSLLKQTHDFSSTGLYPKLISSLCSSSHQFSEKIATCLPKHTELLDLYLLSIQSLNFSYVLKESIDSASWNLTYKQLDLIVHLLPFDVSHYFLNMKESIESINTLILHYLETNDEMNDMNLITTISVKVPLDPNDDILQNSFDRNLYNRELAIYSLSNEQDNRREQLLLLREEHCGLTDSSLELFLRTGEIEKIKLSQRPIWEQHEIVYPVVDTSEIENLKTKVKVLQSKLLDEKKFQQELIDLHRKIRISDEEKQQLESKLKVTKVHENQLQDQIRNITLKLKKYGIDKSNSIADEYEILEKKKLLETIQFQRSLLNKLTSDKTVELSLTPIQRRNIHNPAVPTSIFRRIDKLFDINLTPLTNSQNLHTYKEQQLLEYLHLY